MFIELREKSLRNKISRKKNRLILSTRLRRIGNLSTRLRRIVKSVNSVAQNSQFCATELTENSVNSVAQNCDSAQPSWQTYVVIVLRNSVANHLIYLSTQLPTIWFICQLSWQNILSTQLRRTILSTQLRRSRRIFPPPKRTLDCMTHDEWTQKTS